MSKTCAKTPPEYRGMLKYDLQIKQLELTDLFLSSGKWASFFPFQSQLFSQLPPPPCMKERKLHWSLGNAVGEQAERLKAYVWVWTFFGESFFTFLASSLRGCSGIEGGGGEACLMAELLRSLPPEWVDDSDVVRERRPEPCRPENTNQT